MPPARSADRPSPLDPQQLLAAHVRFELARWSGDELERSIRDEVTAWFAWLEGVTASEICGPEEVADAAIRGAALVLSDEGLRTTVIGDVVAAARDGLAEDLAVADLLDEEAYGRLTDSVVAMTALRDEVIEQVTASPAYANLLGHVLYHGLKAFVLTENVVARRVPGASSLVRFGQSAVRSAAPGLERGIDRQLTAFVNAQIADSIKDSRRYLDEAMDPSMLQGIAADLWEANADRPLADGLELVPEAAAVAGVTVLVDSLVQAMDDGRGDVVALALADRWFDRNGDRPLGQVLAHAGITVAAVLPELLAAARPVMDVALSTGYLEERIRARLAPFYATLPGG
jgi:hypothetical protein